jgi:aminopeptidase N
LRQYFAKHAWGNTTLNDLLVELEATSGRSLKPWVSTWLQTAGVNTLRPAIEVKDGKYSKISVAQEAPLVPKGSTELRPHRMAVGLYDLNSDKLTLRKSVELDVAGALTSVDQLIGEKEADLILLNDRDLSYAKIRFDERSIATLTKNLAGIEDPLTRALCWSASWDMLRDGELSASQYVPMAISGLATEKDVSVVSMTLIQMGTAVELFACAENRDKVREQMANGLEILLENSAPGSDMQLQYARSFTTAAFSDRQNARIRQILEGDVAGLVVDADLRWHFLGALAERGKLTEAEIAKEVATDNTASGLKSAAFCRAALPAAEVKAKAWQDAFNSELSNHIQLATIGGMQRPSQRELLIPYVDKYFDCLVETWEKKSYEIASNIVSGLFPAYLVSDTNLAKAESWLSGAGKDAPAALRRLLSENRDAMARALKAQGVDAKA